MRHACLAFMVIDDDGLDHRKQWSTGLGFDGPTKKACPVVGLSRLMDKPVAKCGNCERERSGSRILVDCM
jgi:hypothetical protein